MRRFLYGTFGIFGSALRAILVGTIAASLIAGGVAVADYAVTQGSGTNFASKVISSVHYIGVLICDATAGESQCATVNASGQLVTSVANSNPNGQATKVASVPVVPASDWSNDACWATISKSLAILNQTANAQVISGNLGLKTYICSMTINSATAQSVNLVEGTGTVCATGIAGMLGGTTAATGPSLAVAGTLQAGSGSGTVAIANAATSDNVCLLQSGAGQISGVITYVQK